MVIFFNWLLNISEIYRERDFQQIITGNCLALAMPNSPLHPQSWLSRFVFFTKYCLISLALLQEIGFHNKYLNCGYIVRGWFSILNLWHFKFPNLKWPNSFTTIVIIIYIYLTLYKTVNVVGFEKNYPLLFSKLITIWFSQHQNR